MYVMGRPVRVVRGSSGLDVDIEDDVVGTRVEAIDKLSSSVWYWDGIVVVLGMGCGWDNGVRLYYCLTDVEGWRRVLHLYICQHCNVIR